MADVVLQSLGAAGNCNLAAGVLSAIFFKQSDVDKIKIVNGEITEIAFKAAKQGVAVYFAPDEAKLDDNLVGGFGTFRSVVLNLHAWNGFSQTTTKILHGYDKTSCLAAVCSLANGSKVLVGLDYDEYEMTTDANDFLEQVVWKPKQNGGNTTTGTVRDSGDIATNKATRAYTWQKNNPCPFLTSAFDLATLTA